MYSVQIKATGRYVKYCDDCWYEASKEPWRLYSKEEAEKIAKQMRKHYVYAVIISDGANDTYEVNGIKKPEPIQVEKKSIGKIKIKI